MRIEDLRLAKLCVCLCHPYSKSGVKLRSVLQRKDSTIPAVGTYSTSTVGIGAAGGTSRIAMHNFASAPYMLL